MKILCFLIIALVPFTQKNFQTKGISVSTPGPFQKNSLVNGWYFASDTPTMYKRKLEKTSNSFYVNPRPIVTAKNFVEMQIVQNKGEFIFRIKFNDESIKKWEFATDWSFKMQRPLLFIVKNKIVKAPIAYRGRISDGRIDIALDRYSQSELQKIKASIENEK